MLCKSHLTYHEVVTYINKWQRQDVNPEISGSKAHTLPTTLGGSPNDFAFCALVIIITWAPPSPFH